MQIGPLFVCSLQFRGFVNYSNLSYITAISMGFLVRGDLNASYTSQKAPCIPKKVFVPIACISTSNMIMEMEKEDHLKIMLALENILAGLIIRLVCLVEATRRLCH